MRTPHAALLREFYQREGMAVPPPPKVSDTDLLTLDKAQAEAAAKQYGCSYVGCARTARRPAPRTATLITSPQRRSGPLSSRQPPDWGGTPPTVSTTSVTASKTPCW